MIDRELVSVGFDCPVCNLLLASDFFYGMDFQVCDADCGGKTRRVAHGL